VLCNIVRETGDDMIAAIGYGIGEPRIGNFLIAGNDLADQYWGRGITVSGSRDVTLRGNKIAGTMAAGILVTSEPVYKTSNVRNVMIDSNDISRIQMALPTYNPLTPSVATGQGAIDVHGYSSQQVVTDVLIQNNYVHDVRRDAAFVRGDSIHIGIINNKSASIGRDAIRIESIAPTTSVYCSGNDLNGVPASNPDCRGAPPRVTGSSF